MLTAGKSMKEDSRGGKRLGAGRPSYNCVKVNISLPRELWNSMKVLAKSEGLSLSGLIRRKFEPKNE
jgi:hypothetical protein